MHTKNYKTAILTHGCMCLLYKHLCLCYCIYSVYTYIHTYIHIYGFNASLECFKHIMEEQHDKKDI